MDPYACQDYRKYPALPNEPWALYNCVVALESSRPRLGDGTDPIALVGVTSQTRSQAIISANHAVDNLGFGGGRKRVESIPTTCKYVKEVSAPPACVGVGVGGGDVGWGGFDPGAEPKSEAGGALVISITYGVSSDMGMGGSNK